MNLAVLCDPKSWYFRDLQRSATDSIRLTALPFSALGSSLIGDRCEVTCLGLVLSEFDSILVRTMPPGTLEQVVFRMDALHRLHSGGILVVNPPRSLEAAIDKYLTTSLLQQSGLQTPRTVACQTVEDAMEAFIALGGDVVVKPIFGGEGRGLTRISDEAIALRAFKTLTRLGTVIYLQEFIDHPGYDIRLLVLGNRLYGMKRTNHADWRTNASRGATTTAVRITEELAELAFRSAATVGASFVGVDVLPAKNGISYVIEVNSVPGWKALSSTLNVDIARQVLRHLHESLLAA